VGDESFVPCMAGALSPQEGLSALGVLIQPYGREALMPKCMARSLTDASPSTRAAKVALKASVDRSQDMRWLAF